MTKITPEYLKSQGLSETFPNRFWSKVKKTDGCWLWVGATATNGYGEINRGSKVSGRMYTHRASWMLHFGPLPHGLCVCHSCDNRICVNPRHLWLGTDSDNFKDMWNKGRANPHGGKWMYGLENPNGKLTDAQVVEIRRLSPRFTQWALANRFGVHQATIWRIIHFAARTRHGE